MYRFLRIFNIKSKR